MREGEGGDVAPSLRQQLLHLQLQLVAGAAAAAATVLCAGLGATLPAWQPVANGTPGCLATWLPAWLWGVGEPAAERATGLPCLAFANDLLWYLGESKSKIRMWHTLLTVASATPRSIAAHQL